MAELDTTQNFVDGQVVNAATLNNIMDLGIALEGLISDKTDTVPAAGDYVLFWKSGSLFKCKFSELPANVTSVGLSLPSTEFNVTGSPVTTAGTLGATWKNQPGNKYLAGNGTGGGTTPSFRLFTSDDLTLASVTIAATTIDWSLGNLFYKQLTAPGVTFFTFSNVQDGQTIQVLISRPSGTQTFGAPSHIWWKGAAYPVQANVAGVVDIWTFSAYGTAVLGKGDMGYLVID